MNDVPPEAPVFRHPVYDLVEILPVIAYDTECESGISVAFYRVSQGARDENDWSTLDSSHLTNDPKLFEPITPAAEEVVADVCMLVAVARDSRAANDTVAAARYRQRAKAPRAAVERAKGTP